MKFRDQLWLGFLLAVAAFVWFRDTAWLTSADEVLPLPAAPSVFLWLDTPWSGWRKESGPIHANRLIAALLIFMLGLAPDGSSMDWERLPAQLPGLFEI